MNTPSLAEQVDHLTGEVIALRTVLLHLVAAIDAAGATHRLRLLDAVAAEAQNLRQALPAAAPSQRRAMTTALSALDSAATRIRVLPLD